MLLGTISIVITVMCLNKPTQPRPIIVHGDSTAIASRIPWHEKWRNVFPSLDNSRWWVRLGKSYSPNRPVFNDGEKGQDIATLRKKIQASAPDHSGVTIIYDRMNTDESYAYYLQNLKLSVGYLKTDHFLIMPQVPSPKIDAPQTVRLMTEVDKAVNSSWPNNTFNDTERRDFIAALSSRNTRADGLHRNALGQEIEFKAIKIWIDRRSW